MENFRIESLEINKIGAFEHIKMDFPEKTDPDKAEIHILTGENGTGKTTILEVLVESFEIKSEQRKVNLYKKILSEDSNFIIKYKNFDDFKYTFEKDHFKTNKNTGNHGRLIDYLLSIDKNSNYSDFTNSNGNKVAFFAYSGYRRVSEVKVVGPKEIKDNPLKDALDFNKSINPENFIQWVINTVTRELNAKGRGDFEKAIIFKKFLNQLEEIISDIIDKPISFDIDDDFNVLMIIDELLLDFDVLPDGLKSMISWIGDLLMRMDRIKWKDDLPIFERNIILFLDEIEVHLHPAWQRKILPVVQKLFKNAQIFISTHSPFVVGSVDGAWVHKLKKDGAYAVLDGEPTLSSDGKTFVQILSDTFDITSLFGEQNERKILKFKEIKNLILSGQDYDETEFNTLIDELSNESRALENLIGLEIRQINKTLGINILDTHATI